MSDLDEGFEVKTGFKFMVVPKWILERDTKGNALSSTAVHTYTALVSYANNENHQTVEKGSITINGVSLTVVESGPDFFSVAIIPYTWDNTNFCKMNVGDFVNLEFDIIGKYVAKILKTNESLKL